MKKWEINNIRIGWVALVFSGDRKVVSINPHVSSSAENLSMCCDMVNILSRDGPGRAREILALALELVPCSVDVWVGKLLMPPVSLQFLTL